MLKKFKNIDGFTKNIILVFAGSSLINLFNLLYQLLIAHKLTPPDFAGFNSLLSLFTLIVTPLLTLQIAVVKYSAEFNACNQLDKLKFLLSSLLKKTVILGVLAFLIFYFASFYIMDKLKIPSDSCGYILALLIASSCIAPALFGALQGLELFNWLMFVSIVNGLLKLALTFLFILLGFNIAGALGALLLSNITASFIAFFPLRKFLSLKTVKDNVDFKDMLAYLFPLAIGSFCFIALVNLDIILVKYFFPSNETGLYSLAQMIGKIFLFLPGAVSIVMFPRTSGLNAKRLDTISTLNRSLLYAGILCAIASLTYNIFPSFILKLLTGKTFNESIVLGRLFSVSMSFFTLLYILITYFLSKKDLRFIKYLASFTALQFLSIVLFHKNLMQVQGILCVNAVLLFVIHFYLAYKNRPCPIEQVGEA